MNSHHQLQKIHTATKAEVHTEPGKDPNNPYAAAIGPTRKTHDLSNPFGGTSWGASQGDSMRR